METTEKEIIDMENFYATATLEDMFAYFKAKSAHCFTKFRNLAVEVKHICAGVRRLLVKKNQSCLKPMGCRTIYPLGYHIGAAHMPQNSTIFQFNFGYWLGYIYQVVSIDQEIAMEETLQEAQNILIKK
jgi:hypothetical protein